MSKVTTRAYDRADYRCARRGAAIVLIDAHLGGSKSSQLQTIALADNGHTMARPIKSRFESA